jgi:hypothetical protein
MPTRKPKNDPPRKPETKSDKDSKSATLISLVTKRFNSAEVVCEKLAK